MFLDSFRKFLAREVEPLVAAGEADHRFPVELFKKFGKLGYLGITYPETFGGMNLGYITLTLFAENLGKVNSGFAGSILSHMSIAFVPDTQRLGEEGKVEYPVERYFRDAKSMTIIEGTSEIQQIIARHLAD